MCWASSSGLLLGWDTLLHVSELVVDPLVHYVLGVDTTKLVIVAIYDQSLNYEVFKAVVMSLHNQVLKTA
jgi:hypothetical protein